MPDISFDYDPATDPMSPQYQGGQSDGGGVSAGDVGRAAGAGALDTGAQLSSGVRAIGDASGDQNISNLGDFFSKLLHYGSQRTEDGMSDDARGRLHAAITSPEFWEHPLSAATLKAANMAPGVAVAIAPAMLTDGALAPWLVAGAGGIQGGAAGADDVYSKTDNTSDADLQAHVPYYAGLRSMGVGEQEARADLNTKLMKLSVPLNAAAGAAAMAMGPAGRLAGLIPEEAGAGILKRMGVGAGEGALGGALMGGTGEAAHEKTEVQLDQRTQLDPAQILAAAGDSAATMGAMGAVGGVFTGGHGTPASESAEAPGKEVQTVDARGPDAAQTAALTVDKPAPVTPEGNQAPITESPKVEPAAKSPVPTPAPTEVPSDAAAPSSPGVSPADVPGVLDTPAPATADDTGKTVPESQATLQAQQDQLVNGQRRAMLFPKGGDAPLPLPEGMKQIPLKAGMLHYNPDALKYKDAIAAHKEGRLNDILDLGDYSKKDIAPKIAAGEKPLAVTERMPDGTEVKAAAGTESTAASQVQSLEATKTPGNTVQVEPVRQVLTDRVAAAKAAGEKLRQKETTDEKTARLRAARLERDAAAKRDAAPTKAERLVIARKNHDGSVEYGKAGQLHSELLRAGEDPNAVTDMGWARPGGEYLTREQAREYVRQQQPEVFKQYGGEPEPIEAGGYESALKQAAEPAPRVAPKKAQEVRVEPIAEEPAAPKQLDEKAKAGIEAHLNNLRDVLDKQEKAGFPTQGGVDAFIERKRQALTAEANAAAGIEAPKPAGTRARATEKGQGKKRSENEKAARRENNATADEVVKQFEPTPEERESYGKAEGRQQLFDRLQKMVGAFQEKGGTIPGKIKDNTHADMEHNSSVTMLVEARDLLKRGDDAGNEDLARFVAREFNLRTGEEDARRAVIGERRAEGDQKMARRKTSSLEKIAEPEAPEPEKVKLESIPDETAEPREEAEDAPEETASEPRQDPSRERAAVTLKGNEVTAVKDRAGTFKAETVKRRQPRRLGDHPWNEDRPVPTNAEVEAHFISKVKPTESSTLGNYIAKGEKNLGGSDGVFARYIGRRLAAAVGDTPVHIISGEDMKGILGGEDAAAGFYFEGPKNGRTILINEDLLLNHEDFRGTLLHEGMHAAAEDAIESSARDKQLIRKMMNLVAGELGDVTGKESGTYGLTDEHEFMSEAMSNPHFWDVMSNIQAPPEMIREFNLGAGKKNTIMDMLVHFVRRALGLGDSKKDFRLIEAAIRLGDRLATRGEEMRNPGDTRLRANYPTPANDESGMPSLQRAQYLKQRKVYEDALAVAEKQLNTLRLARSSTTLEQRMAARAAVRDAKADLYVYEHRASSPLHDFAGLRPRASFKATRPGDFAGAETDINKMFHEPLSDVMARSKDAGVEYVRGLTQPGKMIANTIANAKGAGGAMRKAILAVTTNDQYRQQIRKLLPMVDEIFDNNERVGVTANKLKEAGIDMVGAMIRAQKINPGLFEKFAALVNEQTMVGADASSALGEGRNSHLVLSKALQDKLAKGHALDDIEHDTAMNSWEARNAHPELQKRYQEIVKADPQYAHLQKQLFDYFEEAQADMARGQTESILRSYNFTGTAEERAAAARKLSSGKLTDDERADLVTKLGVKDPEKALERIEAVDALKVKKGPYAPQMRRGEHAVVGEYKITEPGNGRKVGDNMWEFKTREEAHDFATKTDLHTEAKSVWYDTATGLKVAKKADAISTAGQPEQRFQVRVQRQHLEFHESAKEAKARLEELKASGLLEKIGLEERRNIMSESNDFSARGVESLLRSLASQKHYMDASEHERGVMRHTIREAGLRAMSDNRVQARRLPRRYVEGASDDIARNLYDYNNSQANFRARLQFNDAIDDGLKQMWAHVKAERYTPANEQRSIAANEVERRMRQPDPNEYSGSYAEWTRRLSTWSYIDRMMRPSHLILHQTHLPMITAPYMSGRHGVMSSYGQTVRAWKELTGFYKAGVSDSWATTWGSALQKGADYAELGKKAFSGAADGGRIGKMLDSLAEIGVIHPSSGIEAQKYMPSRQLSGVVGALDTSLNKVDTIFRHLTNATEAVNRIAGATAAYRLEFRKLTRAGKSEAEAHKAAVDYARQTLTDTQGLYSSTNAAPIFKNRFLKPFLQFKQFPQMMYHLLGKLAVQSFKGETRQAKVQAMASLAAILGMHSMMAGVLQGLPLEPFKLLGLISKGIGLTDGDWSDVEDAERRSIKASLGNDAGNLLIHGLGSELMGVDVHHRMGLNSFATWGMPEQLDSKSMSEFVMNSVLGAPGSLVTDALKGTHKMLNGDIEGGALQAAPLQALRDLHNAINPSPNKYGYEQTGADKFKALLGFTPAAKAQASETKEAVYQATHDYDTKRNNLTKEWLGATDKDAVWQQIADWNSGQAAAARLTKSDLFKALHRQNRNAVSYNRTIDGVNTNPHNKGIAQSTVDLYK